MNPQPISVAAARALDQDAVTRLGMPSILLMENAARSLAELAAEFGRRYLILCGPGNNGGDGLAAARHLGTAAAVHLLAEPDPKTSPDAALQLDILRRAGWQIPVAGDLPDPQPGEVWVDALFGTGLSRALDGLAATWVEQFNAAPGPRLSADIPSGLDGDSGEPLGPTCQAQVTLSFAAAKQGMLEEAARPYVGELRIAGLGIPPSP